MRRCSVTEKLKIGPGDRADYDRLKRFHYRDGRLGPYAAIFALKPTESLRVVGTETVGVIVYTMPSPAVELRNIATANLFAGFDRATQIALVNGNVRCISRVIIEPRFRGLGLAAHLVRQTMPKMDVPIVEAMAVMGQVNPFFEKAGMYSYTAGMPARCVQLVEAFSIVGIEKNQLVSSQEVYHKLQQLPPKEAGFIEVQIGHFLRSYGRRANMKPGLERTRFILSRLTSRPVYYIWFNPNMDVGI